MTDIILGLQGEIPVNHTKGVPYVAGKYDIILTGDKNGMVES